MGSFEFVNIIAIAPVIFAHFHCGIFGCFLTCGLSWPSLVVDQYRKMKGLILPIVVVLTILCFAEAFQPRSRILQPRTWPKDDDQKILDVFSLSFKGDFGLSRMYRGFSKIVEGVASCKYF